jgi:hypothetical protein
LTLRYLEAKYSEIWLYGILIYGKSLYMGIELRHRRNLGVYIGKSLY